MRHLSLLVVLLAASPAWAQSAFDGTYFGTFYETCRSAQSDGSAVFSVAGGALYYVSRQGGEPEIVQIQANGTLSGHVRGGSLTGRAAPPHLDFVVQNGDCSISFVLDRK